jgi:hypothetical protein
MLALSRAVLSGQGVVHRQHLAHVGVVDRHTGDVGASVSNWTLWAGRKPPSAIFMTRAGASVVEARGSFSRGFLDAGSRLRLITPETTAPSIPTNPATGPTVEAQRRGEALSARWPLPANPSATDLRAVSTADILKAEPNYVQELQPNLGITIRVSQAACGSIRGRRGAPRRTLARK